MGPEQQPGPTEQNQPSSSEQLGHQLEQIHQQSQTTPEPAKDGRVRRFLRNAAVVAGIGGLVAGGAELASHQQSKPEHATTPSTAPETPGPTATAEVQNPEAQFLPGELENINKVVDLESVGKGLKVLQRQAGAGNSHFVGISLDGTEPGIDLNSFLFTDTVLSEMTSKGLTINYETNPNGETKVNSYAVTHGPQTERYFIFAPESTDFTKLDPGIAQSSATGEAFTKCGDTACVTLIKRSHLEPQTGLSESTIGSDKIAPNRVNAFIEAARSSVLVTGGQLEAERVAAENNITAGLGLAMAYAEQQVPYADFQSKLKNYELPNSEQTGAHIYRVDQTTYEQMSARVFQ